MEHVLALEQKDDREDHRRSTTHRSAYEHRLGGRLEGVPGPVVGFEVKFTHFEIGIEPEVSLDLLLDAGMFSVCASSKMDWALSVTGP